MKNINELFREIIQRNELGTVSPYKFSDPDGVRSGKSGWSFGVCQFDTQNNAQAIACLRECGFTQQEIEGIVNQTIDVKPLERKLAMHADVIERYDIAQLQRCLEKAEDFIDRFKIPVADDTALLAIADTINQYGSISAGTAARLQALNKPISGKDVLDIKLTWKYATATERGRADTIRRFNNIMDAVG